VNDDVRTSIGNFIAHVGGDLYCLVLSIISRAAKYSDLLGSQFLKGHHEQFSLKYNFAKRINLHPDFEDQTQRGIESNTTELLPVSVITGPEYRAEISSPEDSSKFSLLSTITDIQSLQGSKHDFSSMVPTCILHLTLVCPVAAIEDGFLYGTVD
jgi:hypothetical protein